MSGALVIDRRYGFAPYVDAFWRGAKLEPFVSLDVAHGVAKQERRDADGALMLAGDRSRILIIEAPFDRALLRREAPALERAAWRRFVARLPAPLRQARVFSEQAQ